MLNEDKKNRIVGLVRVSTHIQSEGSGLQFQTEKIQQYSQLNDFNIVSIVSDVCSGSYETRDGIEEVKNLLNENKILNGVTLIALQWFFLNFYKN